jgi:hypothetical protein
MRELREKLGVKLNETLGGSWMRKLREMLRRTRLLTV